MSNDNSKTQQEELALEIARGLGEEEFLPIYRSFASRFSEELLRTVYEETLRIPAEKIRKSRGAIFNYLLKKHARKNQSNTKNPGH